MTDIKGLSLGIVQHRIYLNEEATPKRDPQCRLNPIMQEAIRTEIVTPRSRNTYLVAYSYFLIVFLIYFLYLFCVVNYSYDRFALDLES